MFRAANGLLAVLNNALFRHSLFKYNFVNIIFSSILFVFHLGVNQTEWDYHNGHMILNALAHV